ncbi:hypothetical protein LIER_10691 [Lithospermum erythrorhizon]|uniref:BLISTER n=1 Tax=Lithospermum erythrorhizon TaxID=34254 RepID=A0AAV3PP97_LITER
MKKQKDLEAGRRKLEEFRKKKAAEKAKKAAQAAPATQIHASNGNIQDNQLSEAGRVSAADPDGASTTDDMMKNDVTSSSDLSTDHSIPYTHHSSKQSENPHVPEFSNETNSVYNHQERNEARGRVSHEMKPDQFTSSQILPVQETISASSHSSINDDGIDKLSYGNSRLMDNVSPSPETSYSSVMNVSPEKSTRFITQDISGYSERLDDKKMFPLKEGPPSSTMENALSDIGKSFGVHKSFDPTVEDSNSAGPGAMFNGIPSSSWSSDRLSGLGSVTTPPAAGNNRRSRPSFLDTINISRGPTATSSFTEPVKTDPIGSLIDPLQSSLSKNPVDDSVASGEEVSLGKHLINGTNENNLGYHSQKQNEDFAALEQHIEDLTQEKFSLQRALEASQTLAASLASENSSLTESYNQQGSVVAQLKGEMEMLQEEIKALLVELESLKLELSNALLECNAADERANLLASEVIGLEEKALRLRSNELKLERELENRLAETSSLKKKMSSLEKDIRDLQSTIDALQEEKKLLQSKLRKASTSGKLVDSSKSITNSKDAATSTMDLGDADDAASTTEIISGSYAPSLSSTNENGLFALDELSLTVPPDHLRIFQSISVLISELAIEKDELVRALSAELSHNTELQESNKELTRKLETQTQRLELLTSQRMSSGNVPVIQVDSRNLHDSTTYADEGDEVVERVLGWIMKLFPGGPSRRRTSKLL